MLTCHKQVDSGLRRALATSGQGADPDEGDSAYLVPVQVSGLDNCQWLKVGGRFPGRYSWIDHDFFEGETERRANAADGNRSALFWHSAQQIFLDSGVEPNAGEAILMHQSGHVAPWVAISGSVDWGQFSNDIFQARLQHNNTVVLAPLPTDHPGRISLIAQCGSELQLEECEALKGAVQNDESRSIAQFADTYWPKVREDFVDALLRNDRASLARMREEGLFSHWLSSGLRALGETSALSLMEKRRRAAWVLALDRPHAAYDAATLDSLLLWLPPEDWRPIVKRLRCYQREQLLEKVKQTKDHTLSSRLRYEMHRFACEAL
ncbi:MAG: hypothetical protein LWW81_05185 [Rhodocyclales bacterium]|nr:hypothetical protein [Rhodocyclales bacterium]